MGKQADLLKGRMVNFTRPLVENALTEIKGADLSKGFDLRFQEDGTVTLMPLVGPRRVLFRPAEGQDAPAILENIIAAIEQRYLAVVDSETETP